MAKAYLTAARLRELLHYNPDTGAFTIVARPRAKAGKVVGNLSSAGYIRISIGGKTNAQAHRLAWLYMTGEWPAEDIDHVNGVRHDNRWSNLRAVSRSVNLQNLREAKSNNLTGLLGVRKNKNRFGACIGIAGKTKWLGTFDTPEQAHAEYLKAKRANHEGCTI